MTKREAIRQNQQENTLIELGFTSEQAEQLRRISMTLQKWYERECGDSNQWAEWAIERDENEAPFEVRHIYAHDGKGSARTIRTRIPDRETGALRRLAAIMASAPTLSTYIQTDPRGAALYILRPGDVPDGCTVDSCYSRGICVY